MSIAIYPLVKWALIAIILLCFGLYFWRNWKQNRSIPRSPIPYVMLVFFLFLWAGMVIRISSPQQAAATASSFDTVPVADEPEIKTFRSSRYEPDDNAKEIDQLRLIGD